MRVVLQKVKQASVTVEGSVVGSIKNGYMLLIGITHSDTKKEVDWMVEKILKLRLFADDGSNTFMEKSIVEVNGSILAVSQFTLYGDCKKGTKPSFTDAARPEQAKELYDYFVSVLKSKGIHTETGIFGAHMEVELVNDGPITLVINS